MRVRRKIYFEENETIKQKTDEVVIKVFNIQQFSDFITPVVYKFQPLIELMLTSD